jgi:hypothetical protein
MDLTANIPEVAITCKDKTIDTTFLNPTAVITVLQLRKVRLIYGTGSHQIR